MKLSNFNQRYSPSDDVESLSARLADTLTVLMSYLSLKIKT